MNVVVLLSGGMDSTACLLRTLDREPVALLADYGQPDAELVAAEYIAATVGVPFMRVAFTMPNLRRDEFDVAFLPGRNLILLTLAAASVEGDCELVIGATLEDQEGFPDCRPPFLWHAAMAIGDALGKEVRVVAPLVGTSKRDAYRSLDAYQKDIVGHSVSCYRGTQCGACGACIKRKAAMS